MLRGVQPVALALSPDGEFLYVAEAGLNAIGVIRLHGMNGRLLGHIPTGWWPSAVRVSDDGNSLYVANARGRGGSPNLVGESQSPKFTVIGTVNIIPKPSDDQLEAYTERVYANNGFVEGRRPRGSRQSNPEPAGQSQRSDRARHLHQQGERHARPDAG